MRNIEINYCGLPVFISAGEGGQPYHWHMNAQEIIWLLQGEVGVIFNNREYILNEEENIILISNGDAHKIIKKSKEIYFLAFYLNVSYFDKYIPDISHIVFSCNPGSFSRKQRELLSEIKRILARIVNNERKKEKSFKTDINNDLIYLLTILRNHFNFAGKTFIDYRALENFNRTYKICSYIYEHSREKVTLADAAACVHVSRAYLSRNLKEITGMNFVDMLNWVRCEDAIRLLLSDAGNMTAISSLCGFSDVKYFTKYFSVFFGESPTVFKLKNKDEADIKLTEFGRPANVEESLFNKYIRPLIGAEYYKEINYKNEQIKISLNQNTVIEKNCTDIKKISILFDSVEFEYFIHSVLNSTMMMEALSALGIPVKLIGTEDSAAEGKLAAYFRGFHIPVNLKSTHLKEKCERNIIKFKTAAEFALWLEHSFDLEKEVFLSGISGKCAGIFSKSGFPKEAYFILLLFRRFFISGREVYQIFNSETDNNVKIYVCKAMGSFCIFIVNGSEKEIQIEADTGLAGNVFVKKSEIKGERNFPEHEISPHLLVWLDRESYMKKFFAAAPETDVYETRLKNNVLQIYAESGTVILLEAAEL